MPRRPAFPPYPPKKHASGQARITVRGRAHYLGAHGSPASWAEYERLLAEWRAGGLEPRPEPAGPVRTVADLLARFLEEGRRDYLDRDGNERPEWRNFPDSLRPLARLYGGTSLRDFRARDLQAVLYAMADGSWMTAADRARAEKKGGGKGWSRSHCNRSLGRVKTLLRWAERSGYLPEGKFHSLTETVRGFEVDQGGARESDDVAPADESLLAAVRPSLNHVVAAVVDLLLLTAARPKEVRLLRPRDVRRDGRIELARGYWVELGAGVWAVPVRRHKTAHKKVRRVLLLGPKAQAILQPFLEGRPPDAYLFSPAEAMERRAEQRRAARKSRVQPSQDDRRRPGARRPADHYTRQALERSIDYACEKAFPLPAHLGARPGETKKAWKARLTDAERAELRTWHRAHSFFPAQLRHNAATRLVQQFGWKTARIILGHTREEMTRRYGHDDLKRAARAQGKAG